MYVEYTVEISLAVAVLVLFLHLHLVIQAEFEGRWFGFHCFTYSSAVVQVCCCFGLGVWGHCANSTNWSQVLDVWQILWHELLRCHLLIPQLPFERMKPSFSQFLCPSFGAWFASGFRVMTELDMSKCWNHDVLILEDSGFSRPLRCMHHFRKRNSGF